MGPDHITQLRMFLDQPHYWVDVTQPGSIEAFIDGYEFSAGPACQFRKFLSIHASKLRPENGQESRWPEVIAEVAATLSLSWPETFFRIARDATRVAIECMEKRDLGDCLVLPCAASVIHDRNANQLLITTLHVTEEGLMLEGPSVDKTSADARPDDLGSLVAQAMSKSCLVRLSSRSLRQSDRPTFRASSYRSVRSFEKEVRVIQAMCTDPRRDPVVISMASLESSALELTATLAGVNATTPIGEAILGMLGASEPAFSPTR